MKLKVVGSGSKGNCYILESKTGKKLILEAGMSLEECNKYLNYEYSDIEACLITHEHKDHAKYYSQFEANGIKCYMSEGTAEAILGDSFLNLYKIDKKEWNQPFPGCEFVFMPFDVFHDALEPVNYVVYHNEIGLLVFLTDNNGVSLPKIKADNWIIEANYSDENIQKGVIDGRINPVLADRIVENHMSIKDACKALKSNQVYDAKNIILCHLSENNSNELKFAYEITKAVGFDPLIAKKGLEVEL